MVLHVSDFALARRFMRLNNEIHVRVHQIWGWLRQISRCSEWLIAIFTNG